MPTPHIGAYYGDFAKVVLMPGDPKRAQYMAETFLHDYKLVTDVRGILGFTGKTKNGKTISIMASGMGMPSIGIYSNELFTIYGVETIIRVGTCGAYQDGIKLNDIILAEGACTDSNWSNQFGLNGVYSAIASYDVLEAAVDICREKGTRFFVGNILSADVFYDHDKDKWRKWADMGVLGVEMESYALFQKAAELKKRALAILAVSDSFIFKDQMTIEQRQTGLFKMLELGVEVAEKYAD